MTTYNPASSIPEEEIISEINMTPLVDVSLVLVIIFMIVAPFMSNVLKPLNLPTSTRAALSEQEAVKVSIFPDGELAVGPEMVDRSQLETAIQKQISGGKKPWVLIRAGAEVDHGKVMEVVKILKTLKIERLAFAANPKQEAPVR
jgi:biopolymer transport protein ExbD